MPNIMDYLDWRGDLSFLRDPFNEVDNLILCKLCSIDFSGILPKEGGAVTIREAAEKYFEIHGESFERLGVLMAPELTPLLHKLPDTVRFGDLAISNYIKRIDFEREEQFSALTAALPDGTNFITFSGTDDTIVAWKENFNMSVEDAVPAQTDATDYLKQAASKYPGLLRVGGHSKGGNLAVYAALHNSPAVQDRITAVYNNDGPGFRESVLETPAYQRIRPKILTLVPQYSLVGMLLYHEEEYEIVKSVDTGAAAHNGFTWEVCGTSFVRCGDLTLRTRVFDSAMRSWAAAMDMEHRHQFVDSLYDVLTSTGALTLTDLTEHKIKNSIELVQNLRQDPKTLELMTETLELLIKEYVNSARTAFPVRKNPLKTLPMPKNPFKVVRRKKRGN